MKKIAVIGLGLIGGSLAKALKKSDNSYLVAGYDKKEITGKAFNDKTIDKILSSPDEALDSEIIFLCLPVHICLEVFRELAPKLKPDQIITDVCGVKNVFHKEWEKLNSAGVYIGGHPMTGKEKGGYENSDPLLFDNTVYIISRNEENKREGFCEIVKSTGAKIYFVDPLLHDKIVANVSHIPQLLSVALINATANKSDEIDFLDYVGGGYRDMTRIASSDFGIWQPVIENNSSEILDALEQVRAQIRLIESSIKDKSFDSLQKAFKLANLNRERVAKDNKGFPEPLSDLFVYVYDNPGIISRMSTALYEKGINIKDIELLKFRQGKGGAFRIAFETPEESENAKNILQGIGFEVYASR